MKMSAIVEEVGRKPLDATTRSLIFEICCDDANGDEVDVPFVTYHRW